MPPYRYDIVGVDDGIKFIGLLGENVGIARDWGWFKWDGDKGR